MRVGFYFTLYSQHMLDTYSTRETSSSYISLFIYEFYLPHYSVNLLKLKTILNNISLKKQHLKGLSAFYDCLSDIKPIDTVIYKNKFYRIF